MNTPLQKHNPPNRIFNHQFMISNCVYDSMKMKHAHIHTQCQLNFNHLFHNTKFSKQQDKIMNHRSPNELSLGCQQRELRGRSDLQFFVLILRRLCCSLAHRFRKFSYMCVVLTKQEFLPLSKVSFFFLLLDISVLKTNSTKSSNFHSLLSFA